MIFYTVPKSSFYSYYNKGWNSFPFSTGGSIVTKLSKTPFQYWISECDFKPKDIKELKIIITDAEWCKV